MNLKTPRRVVLVGAVATIMVVGIGGIAVGTSHAPILAAGTATDKIKTRGNQPFDVVAQSITGEEGWNSGWHSHPGQAIVIVKEGAFTTYDGDDKNCTGRTYTAGQVYVDPGYGHIHIARNTGTGVLKLHVTYIDVPVGAPFRTGVPAPGNCAF